ncbi:MAG: hypothetical protein EZS28_048121, partial [Streblomastix strix]
FNNPRSLQVSIVNLRLDYSSRILSSVFAKGIAVDLRLMLNDIVELQVSILMLLYCLISEFHSKNRIPQTIAANSRWLARTRWTEHILDRRDSTSSSTNPTYIENSQQDHGSEDKRCYDCTALDLPVLVARTPETDSQRDCFGKLQTKLDNWRQDEKKITALISWRFDDSIIQGQKGELLYFEILVERGLTREQVNQIFQGWHTCWGRHRQRLGQFQKYWNSLNRN